MSHFERLQKAHQEVADLISASAKTVNIEYVLTPTWVMWEAMNNIGDDLLSEAGLTITNVADMVMELFVTMEWLD